MKESLSLFFPTQALILQLAGTSPLSPLSLTRISVISSCLSARSVLSSFTGGWHICWVSIRFEEKKRKTSKVRWCFLIEGILLLSVSFLTQSAKHQTVWINLNISLWVNRTRGGLTHFFLLSWGFFIHCITTLKEELVKKKKSWMEIFMKPVKWQQVVYTATH